MTQDRRKAPVDIGAYVEQITDGPCFICEMLAGNPEYRHSIICQDEITVAFLNKYRFSTAVPWSRPADAAST